MIKSISITNHLDESINMELGRPEKSGFLIKRIDGLGPSKANINSTELSTSDGAIYNSARVGSRNIVLQLKFLDKPTIEFIRQLSYKYFPIKKRIKIEIETDTRICETFGYIESNEPDIFSNQESTQISILCPDPYFYSKETIITVFHSVDSKFEFPFSNESLVSNLIEFGVITSKTEQTIYYSGDSENGVVIKMHALGPATNITIYNTGTKEKMRIDSSKLVTLLGAGINSGDEIIISTVKGSKYISLFRNGVYYNIFNCLDKGANWFQLTKGDNVFAYTTNEGLTNLEFRIEHQIVYEGI